MRARPYLAILVALAIVGCETRPPLTRGNAISSADSLLLRDHRVWGNPLEVLPPGSRDSHGHRWWQVRYADGPEGLPRIVLIDDESGWARIAPKEYRPAVAVRSRPIDPAEVALQPGDFILQVAPEQPAERDAEVRLDVAELNRLAARTGLYPCFSLRAGRDGSLAIVYGWSDGHGMPRDESVRDWLALRTRFADSRWIDLRN
ncbi:MAG: hypothetical protein H0W72_00100 [Planctomycetes bacterium]|nr:hypothetical protein [Planctomycetota bacterium]